MGAFGLTPMPLGELTVESDIYPERLQTEGEATKQSLSPEEWMTLEVGGE